MRPKGFSRLSNPYANALCLSHRHLSNLYLEGIVIQNRTIDEVFFNTRRKTNMGKSNNELAEEVTSIVAEVNELGTRLITLCHRIARLSVKLGFSQRFSDTDNGSAFTDVQSLPNGEDANE